MNNPTMHLTDSLPRVLSDFDEYTQLDKDGLNLVCFRATAAAHAAKANYQWAAAQTPGAWGTQHVLRLAKIHHMKADALCALLGRKA